MKTAQFIGGPRDGEVWHCKSSQTFIPSIGYVPKHERYRHVYKLTKAKGGEHEYRYVGAERRVPADGEED